MHHFKSIGEFKLELQSRNAQLELESGNAQFRPKSEIFYPVWPWNLMADLEKRAPLLYYVKLYASFQIHRWIQTGVTVWKRWNQFKIGDFVSCVNLKIRWMTLKNDRAPVLYFAKLFASFQIHWWIQTGVRFRKRSIRAKIFLSHVALKFDGWPWKTKGHLFYVTLCFMHHFKTIVPCDLEIWLMTLKNNRAPL